MFKPFSKSVAFYYYINNNILYIQITYIKNMQCKLKKIKILKIWLKSLSDTCQNGKFLNLAHTKQRFIFFIKIRTGEGFRIPVIR